MTERKFTGTKGERTTRLDIFQEAVSLDEAFQMARIQAEIALDKNHRNNHKAYVNVMDGKFGKIADKVDMVVEAIGESQSDIAKRFAERTVGAAKSVVTE